MPEIDVKDWAKVPEYWVTECAAMKTDGNEVRFYYSTTEETPEKQKRRVPIIKLVMPLDMLREIAGAVMKLVKQENGDMHTH